MIREVIGFVGWVLFGVVVVIGLFLLYEELAVWNNVLQ